MVCQFLRVVSSEMLRERLGVDVRRDLASAFFRCEGYVAMNSRARFNVTMRAVDREMKSEIASETRQIICGKETHNND